MDFLGYWPSNVHGCGEQSLEVGDLTIVVRSLSTGERRCRLTVTAFPRGPAATPPFVPVMEPRDGSVMVFPRRAGEPAPLEEAALAISPGCPLVLSLCHVWRRGPDDAAPSDGLGSGAGRRLDEEA